jgi:hypothetical protein
MKKIVLLTFYLLHLCGADSFDAWLRDGNVSGNLRYYFIETNKKFIAGDYTSAYGNSIGGQLSFATSTWNGWKLGSTFL